MGNVYVFHFFISHLSIYRTIGFVRVLQLIINNSSFIVKSYFYIVDHVKTRDSVFTVKLFYFSYFICLL